MWTMNLGTIKLGSLEIPDVEIRTQALGFDPESRGCTTWDACLKLPGGLHADFGDDKFHIVKIFAASSSSCDSPSDSPSDLVTELQPKDVAAKDLPTIRKLQVMICLPSALKHSDGRKPFALHTFDYTLDRVLE